MKNNKLSSLYRWIMRLLAWCEDSSRPCRTKMFAGVLALLCALFMVSFLQVMTHAHPKPVAVMDLTRIQTTFLKQASHQSLTKVQMQSLSHRFADALQAATHRVAKQHQGVLFIKGAIVSGGIDVTKAVERDIAIHMHATLKRTP